MIAIGTRVRTTDTDTPCEGVVARFPTTYWAPGRRPLDPGVVWVIFDAKDGRESCGAPWSVDALEVKP